VPVDPPVELTFTVADCDALPPEPVQLNVYVLLDVSALVEADPAVDLLPDHAPLAAQLVALVDDQLRVLELPLVTLVGVAFRDTWGLVGAAVTDTVTDFAIVPPGPEQLREYVLLLVSAPVDAEPETDLVPDHAPLAVQLLVLVDDQVRVLELPLDTLPGLALKVTLGAGVDPDPVTETVTVLESVRSGPVQLKV
jgi:hypothetical protein